MSSVTTITQIRYSIWGEEESRSSNVAVCSVTINNVLVIHKVYVKGTPTGLRVYFPQQSSLSVHDGVARPRDVVHAINGAWNAYFSKTVIDGYNSCKESGQKIYVPKAARVSS